MVKPGAEPQRGGKGGGNSTTDPLAALDAVLGHVEPAIFLFKDFHPYTEDQRCNVAVVRRLRDVAYHLRDTYKTIVIVAPMMRIAPELSKDITVLEFGLPGVDDFHRLLDRIIEDVKDKPRVRINLDAEGRERLLHAARGLTLKEAENVFAKTLVLDGKLDADDVQVVFSEKQQIIKKSGLLEYYESREQFAQVAGLDHLKQWLTKRGLAFSEKAAEFGLPPPKGVLLLGVQGCGKSLCAKAASGLWKLPLLRLDIGRMFGSLVGSSEENMRRAIHTAESVVKGNGGSTSTYLRFLRSDGSPVQRLAGTCAWSARFDVGLPEEDRPRCRGSPPPTTSASCRRNCCARGVSMRSSSSICQPRRSGPRFSASICTKSAGRSRQVRSGAAGPAQRRFQRRGDRRGDHLGVVRRVQPAGRADDGGAAGEPGGDGADVEDDERRAESAARLGSGAGAAGDRRADWRRHGNAAQD